MISRVSKRSRKRFHNENFIYHQSNSQSTVFDNKTVNNNTDNDYQSHSKTKKISQFIFFSKTI